MSTTYSDRFPTKTRTSAPIVSGINYVCCCTHCVSQPIAALRTVDVHAYRIPSVSSSDFDWYGESSIQIHATDNGRMLAREASKGEAGDEASYALVAESRKIDDCGFRYGS